MSTLWRSRWAAVGAAVAVSLGAGGLGLVHATTSTGEKPIYKPINPCRLADTRPAPFTVGPRTSPLGPEESYTLSGWGAVGECTLPSDTTGLALNVTALDQSAATFLTLYPTGDPRPNASNLNPTPGEPPTPNAVNVDLNAAGQFDVFNQFGNVNVIVDVVGYYDDHNHDDRYYTEAEINAKTMFAVVNANGTLRRGTSGVTSQLFSGGFTGDYSVTFPRSVAECGWTVSVTATVDGNNPVKGFAGVTVQSGSTNTLYVQGNNVAGTPTEVPFTVIVNCP